MRREFSPKVKRAAFERAKGHCEDCGQKLFPGNIEYDHAREDFFEGEPTLDNCVVLCRGCHRVKTAAMRPIVDKTRRQAAKNAGIKAKSSPLPGSKASGWRKRMDGTVERRT